MSLVVVLAVASVLGGVFSVAHAGPPSPQIPGSVAAPTAAEASPICDAPDPTPILGPEAAVPSNPTHTLIVPPSGTTSR
jgi:hypothetical protein